MFGIVGVAALAAPVSADSISVTAEQIQISASVAARRYIIVDANGDIAQIISNNTIADLEPEVYKQKVQAGNKLPLTPELARQAQALLGGVKIKPGILYQRQLAVAPQPSPVLKLLRVQNSNK